jgi:catechol 2,3-dioxygenase-like lactoylglutathione lyase family enzyme
MTRAFPDADAAVTHILVVADPARSRRWYEDVLGADVYRAYDTSVVLRFGSAWLLLVEGGGPTDDKPTVTLAPPEDPDRRDHLFTIRVADCHAVYEALLSRGATFLTPPVRHGSETRCFLRDPDGHLFEISEYRAPGNA